MNYIDVGTPSFHVFVPVDRVPIITSAFDSGMNSHAQPVTFYSRLCYQNLTVLSPLTPQAVKRVLEENFVPKITENIKLSEYECPEHGSECGLRRALNDGKTGGFCPISEKFYPEEELKGDS